jgi:hypothetical protein
MGDFNLIRRVKIETNPFDNTNNMMVFNSIIQQYNLEEYHLKAEHIHWSYMKSSPLLDNLD